MLRLVEAGPLDIHMQVALDAALLAGANERADEITWRFWDADTPAVVIGTGGKVAEEVHLERLRADGVPLVRRFSGGGTVVQAPGVLNFTVVTPLTGGDPRWESVRGSYEAALETITAGLSSLGVATRFEPPCDLATDEDGEPRKLSGNAQARKRRAVLVHGTVLVDLDPALLDRYLKPPPAEPDYRAGRSHGAFVTSLRRMQVPASAADVRGSIERAAGLSPDAARPPRAAEMDEARRQAAEKFRLDAWNLRR